jgi:hypothetical protein
MPRLIALLAGLLVSRGGRRLAGRNAGKLALATLAFQLWQDRRARGQAAPAGHPRQRWSGRRP